MCRSLRVRVGNRDGLRVRVGFLFEYLSDMPSVESDPLYLSFHQQYDKTYREAHKRCHSDMSRSSLDSIVFELIRKWCCWQLYGTE